MRLSEWINDDSMMGNMARPELFLPGFAGELFNVSRACKVAGYTRQWFNEGWRNFQTFGAGGHIGRLPCAKGPHPNLVAAEV